MPVQSRVAVVALLLVGFATGARGEDAPSSPPATSSVPAAPSPRKPAPPASAEQTADAVLVAVAADDDAALKALASKDVPDPWLVADELIRRAQHGAAEEFARAAPRADVEALPAYVEARRGKPDDAARRTALAKASRQMAARDFASALESLAVAVAGEAADVVGVRAAMGRGLALAALARLDEAEAAHRSAAEAAERIGWLARATRALIAAGTVHVHGSAPATASEACARALALAERRGDRAAAAEALAGVGLVHEVRGEPAEALAAYARAVAAWEALGDAVAAAATTANIGALHAARGDYSAALAAYDRALVTQERVGDRAGAATTLGNIGRVHSAVGDQERALGCYARALAVQEASGDSAGAAATLNSVAVVHSRLGDPRQARAVHERVLAMRRALGDRAGVATTLRNLGMVHDALGDYDAAIEAFRQGEQLAAALGDRAGAAVAWHGLGGVHHARGDFAQALTCYERALEVHEARGDRLRAAATIGNIAHVHLRLGDLRRAVAGYERALALQEAIGARGEVARTIANLGSAFLRAGDPGSALSAYERALAMQEGVGDRDGIATTQGNLGAVYQALGDLGQAVVWYERSLAAKDASGDAAGAALMRANLGNLAVARGNLAAARPLLEQALATQEALGDQSRAAHTLGDLASVVLALGSPAEAIALARRAVALRAPVVRGLSAEEGAGARDPWAILDDVGARAAVALDDAASLAFFAESGRAAALLEGLRARDALWSAAVPEDLRAEEAKARAAEARAVGVVRGALDGGDLGALRARRAELAAAQERVAAVVSRIQREAKAGAALVYPEAATLDEIGATLGEGQVLVLYALLEKEAVALVVGREGARIVPLGPRAAVDAAAEAVAEAAADGGRDPAAAIAILTDLVAKPLALPATARRLLVSPDGALSYVPFAVLWPDRTVAYVPSGTTHRLLREEEGLRGEGVLALGDPDYATNVDERALAVNRGALGRLAPLPGTHREVEALGDVRLLGDQATEVGLREALAKRPRWRAVHLACHGLVDSERPALSSLAITAAGDDDGFLTCLDVFRMKVPADLVVLSACETGKGKVVKSEGIVGLTRAFMFAGSPRVLCSLWKVDDAATAALMTKFYELWNPKGGKPGLPTAEAMKSAQEFVRSQERWKHPYYWAAWVLWGLSS